MSSLTTTPVDTDLPCAICGYNLKGLAPEANCPECGQPISRTFTFGLSHADPKWLRGQAANLPWLVTLFLLNFGRTYYRVGDEVVNHVLEAVNGLTAIVAAVACFRLAAPDPYRPDEHGTLSRGLKLTAVLLALLMLGDLVYLWMFGRDLSAWPPERRFLLMASAFFLLHAVVTFLTLITVAQLAKRAGVRSLEKQAWTFGCLLSIVPLLNMVPFLLSYGRLPEVFVIVYSVLPLVLSAALYLTLMLLGRMYEIVHAAAREAEARGEPAGVDHATNLTSS